jgi:UDP-GlcNAc:undecaprenyl-phosphate GlcNAc-1-phosphate transferase
MVLSFVIYILAIIGTAYIITHILYNKMVLWLLRNGLTKPNFKGKEIPVGMGIILPLSTVLLVPLSFGSEATLEYLLQAAILLLISLAGWRDDQKGNDEAKGLKGHLQLWWNKGKWSTAMSKAATAMVIAMGVSLLNSSSLLLFILHIVLLLLFTNFINLLDLRPGRALKVFFMNVIILVVIYPQIPIILWIPISVAALFLLIRDLGEQIMIGDAGSNCLGMALGYWTVLYASIELKTILAILLIAVHVYAEKRSITGLIRRIPFLHWIDMLGAKKT